MQSPDNEPKYTIGAAAKKLNVCLATLRIWEKKGLIRPKRIGKNRVYSECEIERLKHIHKLLSKRINIAGIKTIINSAPCWDVKKCKGETRARCPVYIKNSAYA